MSVTETRHMSVAHGTCMMTLTMPCKSIPSSNVGVVFVPPFGIERSGADRLFATLAQALAHAGHTVVLVDPVGTGDSSDIDPAAEQTPTVVEAYTEATAAALTALGSRVGPRFVVGFRFGALALCATATTPGSAAWAGAVLWSPIASGRAYRRELLMLGSATSAGLAEGWSAPGGNIVSPRDLAAVNDLDLNRHGPPAPCVLIVSADTRSSGLNDEVHRSWSEHARIDSHVDEAVGAAHLEDPELGVIPDGAVAAVVQWITAEGQRHEQQTAPDRRTGSPGLTNDRRLHARAMEGPRWSEFPVSMRMADGTPLAAVSTRPTEQPRAALVMLSTGTNPHFGPGRFHVRIARRLALAGFATVRVDRRGTTADPAVVDAYDPRHIDDVIAILRQAPAATGADQLVVAGTCSGAWAAWHAALHGFNGCSVGEVVLINQIIFGADSWDLTDDSPAIAVKTRQSLSDAKRWRAMLRGEINVARSARRLVRYAGLSARNRLHGFDGLASDLELIRRGGVPTTFLFDDEETGLVYLRMHGNGHLNSLIESGQVRLHTVSGAGHVFSSPASVDWLSSQLTDALERAAR